MLSCLVLSYVVFSYFIVMWPVLSFHVMSCYVVSWSVMSFHVMSCRFCHIIAYNTTLFNMFVTFFRNALFHVMLLRHVMSLDVMPCFVAYLCVALRCIILFYVTFYVMLLCNMLCYVALLDVMPYHVE